MEGKKWWLSKTFWVNILALVAFIVQSQTGYVISAEAQLSILGVLNVLLRVVTKAPLTWG